MTTITNTSLTTSDLNATRTATDQELIADFQGANGKNQFTRFGHHNAQNTGHSTTNYWSWATRTNGNYDLAYGTLNSTNTQPTPNNIMNITTDGYVLKANSSTATGLEWAAAGSGGDTNQNAFSNVAVSGQDTVAADSTTDTLNIAAGSNVTITTNASNDTKVKAIQMLLQMPTTLS